MFSLQIVDSDAFLDMPISSQLLYFHLSMRADDDGFVDNPKKIIRIIGTNDDDLKVLMTKRFILTFGSGVIVIKHWRIHNYIQKDRYTETKYVDEKNGLIIKENGAYTEKDKACIQNVSSLDTQVRLGKVRIGKDRLDNTSEETSQVEGKNIAKLIDLFKEINPSYKKFFGNKTQRASVFRLLETHGMEKLEKIIALLPRTNAMDFMPVITTPLQLEDKFAQLATALQKYKNKEPVIL